MKETLRQFAKLFDVYYWQTAILIARNGLARQYRNSFLGLLWTMLQPITMIIIYAFMMPKIMRFGNVHDYALYVVVTLPIWSFYNSGMVYTSLSVINNSETLKRCMISASVFPVADVLRMAYESAVAFVVMYFLAILIFAPFHATVFLVPLYFLPSLMIIGSGAIAIAFLAPYVRDIGQFTTLSMSILYWLTPVIYPYSILSPNGQAWMQWNPFFIMMHPIQMLAYEGVIPGIEPTLRLLGLTVIAIVAGFAIFRACRRNYVYYL